MNRRTWLQKSIKFLAVLPFVPKMLAAVGKPDTVSKGTFVENTIYEYHKYLQEMCKNVVGFQNIRQDLVEGSIIPRTGHFKGETLNGQPIFYELFVDNRTGEYIDGHQIRVFLDWTSERPDLPRWAKIDHKKHYVGYQPMLRQVSRHITTYLNSDLTPVPGTEW
jgi:hypothetical protein